ncbi:hypothetical protein [Pseudogemmobacter bohemicus]|uniref:hypothetical protein n=1 Tax=Pseudogemmobacter bohemicus TaxID=2250708 RepID=UPI000DD45059|nr:hypothetical protein [Pseudogemmobacter bohemicus]
MSPDLDGLPDSLVDLAEALGLRIALVFMREFGGREMRIPKKPGADHPILRALGDDDGRALCHYLADQTVYVPHCRATGRRRAVLDMISAGKTQGRIARELKLSERHVRRIANTAHSETPDLFFGLED